MDGGNYRRDEASTLAHRLLLGLRKPMMDSCKTLRSQYIFREVPRVSDWQD